MLLQNKGGDERGGDVLGYDVRGGLIWVTRDKNE